MTYCNIFNFKHFRQISSTIYQFRVDLGGQKMSSHDSKPKTISLMDVDAVGVDLDHTLCKYKLDQTFTLIYKSLAESVVTRKGYSKELLEPFYKHRDFCTKGLVFDAKKGNFLKLSREGDILRASHGTEPMTAEEISKIYGSAAKWEDFDFLKDTLKQSGSFRYFENYFDMPGCVVCARIVDIIDKEAGKRQDEYNFLPDVMDSFVQVYQRENFADDKGGYFPTYKANPLEYIEPCGEAVRGWFIRLREAGKVTFLLTSSHVDYSESLLENILGKDWKDIFDICMMYARKPGYFTKDPSERPFFTIVDNKEGKEVTTLESGGKYLQGNVQVFHSYLKKVTGKENPQVAYFGDSVRSDIIPPSSVGWYPFLILEELEAEGLEEWSPRDETDAPQTKRTKIRGPSTTEKEFITSGQWGSFFTDQTDMDLPEGHAHSNEDVQDGPGQAVDNSHHSLNTLWGYFIQTYATTAIPQLDYIADMPLQHRFHTFADPAKPTAGFYPQPPQSLKK
ncbi:5'-nucleotidase domain-containing protein 1-like [Diadema setosum]|uniref:5'-nucleotidase domain-containing protein 1-like n=1 Tax=Diadema setosum TaxID=31175 RepID=UPI003B3A6914